jgi:hypothetical protein
VLPERWKKCVDSRGEYVEDWHVQVSVRQLQLKKKSAPVIFEAPCTYPPQWNPKSVLVIWYTEERYNGVDLSLQNHRIISGAEIH